MFVNRAALEYLATADITLFPPRANSLTYHAHLSLQLTLDSVPPKPPTPYLPAVSDLRWIPSRQGTWTDHTASPEFVAHLAALATPTAPCDVDTLYT